MTKQKFQNVCSRNHITTNIRSNFDFFIKSIFLTLIAMSFNLQGAMAVNPYIYKGALPVPGTSSTQEFLSTDQYGTIAQNGNFKLVWQSDGDLSIRFYGGSDNLWTAGTSGKGTILVFGNTDGKLIIKDSGGKVIWTTSGSGGNKLQLLDNRNLVMYNSTNQQIWEAQTYVSEMVSNQLINVVTSDQIAKDYYIPESSITNYLSLRAEGADGGKKQVKEIDGATRFTVNGGAGATMKGVFEVGGSSNMIPPKSIVRFITGKKGPTRIGQTTSGCAGGGGTGILVKKYGDSKWRILVAAGGGGGAYSTCCGSKSEGKSAETSTSGSGGRGGSNAPGGTNGSAGGYPNSSDSDASPGGGAFGGGNTWQSDGGTNRAGDAAWVGGSVNGSAKLPTGGNGAITGGGWGFGGGGMRGIGGGGGGGFSGGGQGYSYNGGGGGGSYLNSSAISSFSSKNSATDDTQDGFATYELKTTKPNVGAITKRADSKKCLDLYHSNTSNGTNIQLYPCNGTGAQNWLLEDNRIKLHYNIDKCFSLIDFTANENDNIHIWDCKSSNTNQSFFYDGITQMIRYLDNPDYCLTISGTNIQLNTCTDGNTNQQWNIPDLNPIDIPSTGATSSIALWSDRTSLLYPGEGKTKNGSPVTMQSYDADSDQNLIINANGSISIAKRTDRCLDQLNMGTANGTEIQVFPCTGYDNQQWYFDGINKILRASRNAYKCLKSAGIDQEAVLWDCENTAEQQFTLDACSADTTPPVAVCKDFQTTSLTAPIAANIDGGSYDNCSISSSILEYVSGNTYKLTIYDPAGNSSSCTAIVK